MTELSLNFIRN